MTCCPALHGWCFICDLDSATIGIWSVMASTSPSISFFSLSFCLVFPLGLLHTFSCIIWAAVLELMEWGGWHGFQSHSTCPLPSCQFPSYVSSEALFSNPHSAPSCLDSFPSIWTGCCVVVKYAWCSIKKTWFIHNVLSLGLNYQKNWDFFNSTFIKHEKNRDFHSRQI